MKQFIAALFSMGTNLLATFGVIFTVFRTLAEALQPVANVTRAAGTMYEQEEIVFNKMKMDLINKFAEGELSPEEYTAELTKFTSARDAVTEAKSAF